jgi:hypothetical protein
MLYCWVVNKIKPYAPIDAEAGMPHFEKKKWYIKYQIYDKGKVLEYFDRSVTEPNISRMLDKNWSIEILPHVVNV